MISETERAKIRESIKNKIARAEYDIVELKELTKPIAPENSIGRISRMDAINNKSVNEASLRQTEEKLNKLKYALDNLDKEDFGICVRCHKAIPAGRLMIMPESTTCVNC